MGWGAQPWAGGVKPPIGEGQTRLGEGPLAGGRVGIGWIMYKKWSSSIGSNTNIVTITTSEIGFCFLQRGIVSHVIIHTIHQHICVLERVAPTRFVCLDFSRKCPIFLKIPAYLQLTFNLAPTLLADDSRTGAALDTDNFPSTNTTTG